MKKHMLIGVLLVGLLGILIVFNGCKPAETVDFTPDNFQTWVSPGIVTIGNFYPKATAEYNLTLHNGNSESTKFYLAVKEPTRVAKGYVKAPDYVKQWVTFYDSEPILEAQETRNILVTIIMPDTKEQVPDKIEFWISAREEQGGTVQIEYATKWRIDMR